MYSCAATMEIYIVLHGKKIEVQLQHYQAMLPHVFAQNLKNEVQKIHVHSHFHTRMIYGS